MKKMLLLFALMAVMATGAVAQDGLSYVGVFADNEYSVCNFDVSVPGAPPTFYFYVYVDPVDAPSLRAAEFAWAIPELGGTVENWFTDLAIGSLRNGMTATFNEPAAGPWVALGTVTLYGIPYGTWIVGETFIPITPELVEVGGEIVEKLLIVDADFNEIDVAGGFFTFNCAGTCDCGSTPTAELNWGSIKALY